MQTPGSLIIPGRAAVLDVVSEREAEIESLRAKLAEMDRTADNDINVQWEREARQLQPLLNKISKIRKDTEEYVIARTSRLLEEQDSINQEILSLRHPDPTTSDT
jgi:hypothetical protein